MKLSGILLLVLFVINALVCFLCYSLGNVLAGAAWVVGLVVGVVFHEYYQRARALGE